MTSVRTYATTTPTMISGSTLGPACDVSSVASTTADSGSLSTATIAAPIRTGTAADCGKPGRCEAMIPAATPRNRAGTAGPPRKLPSDRPYAGPLNTISHANAASDQVPAWLTSPGSGSWPENRTSSTLWPVVIRRGSGTGLAVPASSASRGTVLDHPDRLVPEPLVEPSNEQIVSVQHDEIAASAARLGFRAGDKCAREATIAKRLLDPHCLQLAAPAPNDGGDACHDATVVAPSEDAELLLLPQAGSGDRGRGNLLFEQRHIGRGGRVLDDEFGQTARTVVPMRPRRGGRIGHVPRIFALASANSSSVKVPLACSCPRRSSSS